jgi:5-formyltetrahydrofolate cyclo-ligase
MLEPSKNTLRNFYKNLRHQCSLKEQATTSQKICNHILNLSLFQEASHIALYHAFSKEIDLSLLWQSAQFRGKTYYFPRLAANNTRLFFLPATIHTSFTMNSFGIQEPNLPLSLANHPNELDVIFLPLLAFDNKGNRLGMGKGYYDKTLAETQNIPLIGVAYPWQYCASLPFDAWDVRLTAVITSEKMWTF